MKVDMANFAVTSIRPHLMQQSVEYERKKFQQILEKQPSTSNALWCPALFFHFRSVAGCTTIPFAKEN